MKDKICSNCNSTKNIGEFYKTTDGHKDGYFGQCRECVGDRVRKYKKNNYKQYILAKRKRQRKNPKVKEYTAKYNQAQRGTRIYYFQDQIKVDAYIEVRKAIASGDLVRLSCSWPNCNVVEGTFAHHDDYTRPLDVQWLCRNHHAETHWKDDSDISAPSNGFANGTR